MKKFNEVTVWVIAQTIGTALAWYGVHGNAPAWNVYRFLAWVFFLFFSLAVMCQSHSKKPIAGETSVPKMVSFLSDLAIACILAAYGHFGYAALKMGEQVMEISLYADAAALRKKATEAAAKKAEGI